MSFLTVSPDSRAVAFIDGGLLKLAPLEAGSTARPVAPDVSTAKFALGGSRLLALRRASAGGALLAVRTTEPVTAPTRLAERVADYEVSSDGRHVAFTQASAVAKDVWDLYVATLDGGSPVKAAAGVGLYGFSPDGRWLGRIEGKRNALGRVVVGALLVGPASGAEAKPVGDKVGRFGFAPDGTALWALDLYNEQHDRGTLLVVDLPQRTVRTLKERAHTGEWGKDGRFLAFNVEIIQPLPSMDLYLYVRGEEQAFRVKEGVYGFGISSGEVLLFRSECVRQSQRDQPRACWLNELDLARPHEAPKQILEGIYSFKVSETGERILVSYARMDSDTYDTAVYNRRTQERKTLDTFTLLARPLRRRLRKPGGVPGFGEGPLGPVPLRQRAVNLPSSALALASRAMPQGRPARRLPQGAFAARGLAAHRPQLPPGRRRLRPLLGGQRPDAAPGDVAWPCGAGSASWPWTMRPEAGPAPWPA